LFEWKGYEEGAQSQESAYTLFRARLFYQKKTKMGICSWVEIPSPRPAGGIRGNCISGSEKWRVYQGIL